MSARQLPAAHAVGALTPAAHEKPTGQLIAGTPPGQYLPATQVVAEQTPAVEDCPAGHCVGGVVPAQAKPKGHAVHVGPAVAPPRENVPTEQAPVHVATRRLAVEP